MIQCCDIVRDARDLAWKTEKGVLGAAKMKREMKNAPCVGRKAELGDNQVKEKKPRTRRQVACVLSHIQK